jgi:hypothetical protein
MGEADEAHQLQEKIPISKGGGASSILGFGRRGFDGS